MSTDAIVEYVDGVRFEVNARGHRIVRDQPLDKGRADRGMPLVKSLPYCSRA